MYFLYLPHPFFNSDLPAFLTGAGIIISPDRASLYSQELQLQYQTRILSSYHLFPARLLPFRYPPFAALIYIPLVFLSLPLAYSANFIFSLLSVSLCLLLMRRFVSVIPFWFLLPLAYTPVIYSFLLNQPTPTLILSYFLIFHFYSRNRPFAAGLSLLPLLIKPPYFFISALFLFISWPRRMFLAGISLGLVFCLAISLLLTGPLQLASYPVFVFKTESPAFGTPVAQRINLPPVSAIIVLGLLLACVFILRPTLQSSLVFLPFFLCLLSGHTLGQDLSLLLLPLFFLLRFRPGLGLILLITISLGFFIFPPAVSLLLLISGFYLLFSVSPKQLKQAVKTGF